MSIFSKISQKVPKSSVFNLSEEMKMSCNFGDLVPILCKETLPGDSFKISTELLIKLAPLKAPMMHRVKAYVHYFFVPTFQINSVFEQFINPKANSNNSIVLPYICPNTIAGYGLVNGGLVSSLSDYLGLPIKNNGWLSLSYSSTSPSKYVLIDPFRVYQHIYNSFYRDENLETTFASGVTPGLFDIESNKGLSGVQLASSLGSGVVTSLLALRKRAWAKDYFTSALPSPQAGDDVLIPMQGLVQSDGALKMQTVTETTFNDQQPFFESVPGDSGDGMLSVLDAENTDAALRYKSGLKVVNASSTINDLRRAMALQRFKELAERGGTRYSEMVKNFFGAFLKDYWVDRPIYLGGQVQNIQVGEVVQTSMSTANSASEMSYLGERGGIAHSYGKTGVISLKCPCHGYVMGILSIRPEATYQQGLERMWTRMSLFDWAFPQFARMGEQEIYGREIAATGTPSYDDAVFGYTPRYSEYKTGHCHVCGDFRDSLNYWHLGRVFDLSNPPTLSKEFVMMDNPSYAAFNVTSATARHVFVDLYNRISARRPLPYFGTPSII